MGSGKRRHIARLSKDNSELLWTERPTPHAGPLFRLPQPEAIKRTVFQTAVSVLLTDEIARKVPDRRYAGPTSVLFERRSCAAQIRHEAPRIIDHSGNKTARTVFEDGNWL